MVTETQLYKLIKLNLPNGYDLSLRLNHARTSEAINVSQVEVIKNSLSVYFKSAYKPLRNASGNYVRNSRRVIFNLYTDFVSEDAIDRGYVILGELKNNLLKLCNSTVDVDGEFIKIIDSEIGVDINYIGQTEQGQALFSLEIILTYQ